MSQRIDTVIIGGGQAGLAVSYYLSQQGRPHIVLEQAAQAADAWRNHRWDSFTLNTPNWQSCLAGAECPGDNPDGFLSRDEIVAYFERYIERFRLPVRYNVHVNSVEANPAADGYIVETSADRFEAKNVVLATGLYQTPKVPSFSADFPRSVKQLHSDEYRNPQSLPAGSVLVVGSAQSGAQITEELYQSGRRVPAPFFDRASESRQTRLWGILVAEIWCWQVNEHVWSKNGEDALFRVASGGTVPHNRASSSPGAERRLDGKRVGRIANRYFV